LNTAGKSQIGTYGGQRTTLKIRPSNDGRVIQFFVNKQRHRDLLKTSCVGNKKNFFKNIKRFFDSLIIVHLFHDHRCRSMKRLRGFERHSLQTYRLHLTQHFSQHSIASQITKKRGQTIHESLITGDLTQEVRQMW